MRDQHPGLSAGVREGGEVVLFPHRDAVRNGQLVAGLQGPGDFQRVAVDENEERRRQQLPPEQDGQAQARVLDDPGSMRFEVFEDPPPQHRELRGFAAGERFGFEMTTPIGVRFEQRHQSLIEPQNVGAFPVTSRVVRIRREKALRRTDVAAHEIQQPRDRGRPGPVHAEYEVLHWIERAERSAWRSWLGFARASRPGAEIEAEVYLRAAACTSWVQGLGRRTRVDPGACS